MPNYTLDNCMVSWTPTYLAEASQDKTNAVEVGPWPDNSGWSKQYKQSTGACDVDFKALSPTERTARLFVLFHTLVVRDGVDPAAAHKALLSITEFRRGLAADVGGEARE